MDSRLASHWQRIRPTRTAPSLRVSLLFPHYSSHVGNSHAALSICEHMQSQQIEVRAYQTASTPAARQPFTFDAVPRYLKSLAYRLTRSPELLNRYCESVFLRALREKEVAYLWTGVTIATYEGIKTRGNPLVMERINCHNARAKQILDDAYERIGLPPTHGITDAKIQRENYKLALADFVFAPSPKVEESLRENGVPAEKILPCSYGWDPDRLRGTAPSPPAKGGVTVLFVGTLLVRKGIHLLLDAWSRAGIAGRLRLAGTVPADIAAHCAKHLNRPDVECLGFVGDVGSAFAAADIFAFPSLEEGGPMVVYEAMASGLPVVVSPMGAGRIVRHGLDGFVIDPYDRDAWIETLRRLAADAELRRTMGAAARQRAREFTWAQAGRRRGALLLNACGSAVPMMASSCA
jgi:glycosyltransferase involved in cell wall biosynthesis